MFGKKRGQTRGENPEKPKKREQPSPPPGGADMPRHPRSKDGSAGRDRSERSRSRRWTDRLTGRRRN